MPELKNILFNSIAFLLLIAFESNMDKPIVNGKFKPMVSLTIYDSTVGLSNLIF